MNNKNCIDEMLEALEIIDKISNIEPPNGFFIGTDENLEIAIRSYNEKNYEKAFEFLNVSFCNGNLRAGFYLGDMYYYGIYVMPNTIIAYVYYEKGADHEDSWAKFNIAWMASKDKFKDAMDYSFRQTSRDLWNTIRNINENNKNTNQLSNNESKFELGLLYYKGINTKQDIKKARKIFEEFAKKGDDKAQYYLGEIFQYNVKDYSSAVYWYGQSAVNGNSEAQYSLATLLYEGNSYGLIQNKEKALEWYKKSAESGNIKAQFALGKILIKSENNERKEEGLSWIRKASEQGNISARKYLEIMNY